MTNLTKADLLNPQLERHAEAWEKLCKVHIDYNINPPTLPQIIEAAASPKGFGDQYEEVTLWLLLDVLPTLGLDGCFDADTTIDQIVMTPHGGILNLEAGYFIRLPAPADD